MFPNIRTISTKFCLLEKNINLKDHKLFSADMRYCNKKNRTTKSGSLSPTSNSNYQLLKK